jgi:hypothetical protein
MINAEPAPVDDAGFFIRSPVLPSGRDVEGHEILRQIEASRISLAALALDIRIVAFRVEMGQNQSLHPGAGRDFTGERRCQVP